ncbi:MAG: CRISPR-associated protein Cas4 [Nanoarchaeota archaeon]
MNAIDLILSILFALFIILLFILKRTRVPNTIYKNKIRYSDHAEKPIKAFFSHKYGLAGKPDYILHTKDGLIPLEIKSTPKPKEPYFSHVMQVIAYCFLMEEQNGIAPRYAFLQYSGSNKPFSIQYTQERKELLIKTINEMREYVNINECPDPNPKSRCKLHTMIMQ